MLPRSLARGTHDHRVQPDDYTEEELCSVALDPVLLFLRQPLAVRLTAGREKREERREKSEERREKREERREKREERREKREERREKRE